MAIYRLEAKIIGREKRGRSVVAAAAYRAGSKVYGEREAKTHDYTRRSKGVMANAILAPENAPSWTTDLGSLWNKVESQEKRVDAQLAREFILALPTELSTEDQFQLAADWSRRELVDAGMVVQISLHHDKKEVNPHAHVLATMRRLDGDGFAAKKPREWNDVALLVRQRESWAEAVNTALEKAGHSERVDHRSLKARGIDQIPAPKIGVAATAMKKRGAVEDPKRFQDLRFVKLLNEVMPHRRAIEGGGEVRQMGHGSTWWEKSTQFLAQVRVSARETVLDAWRNMIEPWKRMGQGHTHPTPRDLDMSR